MRWTENALRVQQDCIRHATCRNLWKEGSHYVTVARHKVRGPSGQLATWQTCQPRSGPCHCLLCLEKRELTSSCFRSFHVRLRRRHAFSSSAVWEFPNPVQTQRTSLLEGGCYWAIDSWHSWRWYKSTDGGAGGSWGWGEQWCDAV